VPYLSRITPLYVGLARAVFICTVYDRMFDDLSAEITVRKYIYVVLANPHFDGGEKQILFLLLCQPSFHQSDDACDQLLVQAAKGMSAHTHTHTGNECTHTHRE